MKTFDDFEIIDSHVHPFLETEGVNLGAYGAPVTPQEFVEELRSLGIRQCCGTLLHGQHAEWNEIRNLNDAALRFRDRFPDFYLPESIFTPAVRTNPAGNWNECTGKASAGSENWSLI